MAMPKSEIIRFLKANIEPFPKRNLVHRYRAAVTLIDGTFLPCVVFEDKRKEVDLALKRFEQLREQPEQYRGVVEAFVANGSRLAEHHIRSVEVSRFAWPRQILSMIHGETTMGWTAFAVEMKDGNRFSYGTSYNVEFFDIPEGYTFNDIQNIYSGMLHLDAEGTIPFSHKAHQHVKYFHDKPFFTCYLDGLDAT